MRHRGGAQIDFDDTENRNRQSFNSIESVTPVHPVRIVEKTIVFRTIRIVIHIINVDISCFQKVSRIISKDRHHFVHPDAGKGFNYRMNLYLSLI